MWRSRGASPGRLAEFHDAIAGMQPADIGPVTTTLDGRPIIIELDGTRIIEHPLTGSAA